MYMASGGYNYCGYGYQGSRGTAFRKSDNSLSDQRIRRLSMRLVRLGVLAAMLLMGFWFGTMVSSHAMHVDDAVAVAPEAGATVPEAGAIVSEYGATSYIVKPGDSLWAIAKTHMPEDGDIRQFVHDIRLANGLSSAELAVGQLLFIPAYGG